MISLLFNIAINANLVYNFDRHIMSDIIFRKVGFFMNMNVNVKTNFPTKHVFSKGSVMTLAVSLIVLAVGILGRGICAMIYYQKISVLHSLYQIFGTGSVAIVNIIISVLTSLVLIAVAVGLFYAKSSISNEPASAAGLSFLKTVLIIAAVYSALGIVVSFASVSVINYTDIDGYTGFINFSATGMFWLTFFLGIALLCVEISFIRMCSAMTENLRDGSIVKKGAGLSFFAGTIGILTCAVAFCVKLFHLVNPPADYIKNITADRAARTLSGAQLILNCFNVIIFAAAVVIFVSLVIIAASYATANDNILRSARSSYYNAGHTVINPENLQDFSSAQNYNYHQSPDFTPYYQANQTYQTVNKNIFNGEVPPVPQAPQNPFIPKTQYPNANPNFTNTPNPVYQTAPTSAPSYPQTPPAPPAPSVPTAPTVPAPDLSKHDQP